MVLLTLPFDIRDCDAVPFVIRDAETLPLVIRLAALVLGLCAIIRLPSPSLGALPGKWILQSRASEPSGRLTVVTPMNDLSVT